MITDNKIYGTLCHTRLTATLQLLGPGNKSKMFLSQTGHDQGQPVQLRTNVQRQAACTHANQMNILVVMPDSLSVSMAEICSKKASHLSSTGSASVSNELANMQEGMEECYFNREHLRADVLVTRQSLWDSRRGRTA